MNAAGHAIVDANLISSSGLGQRSQVDVLKQAKTLKDKMDAEAAGKGVEVGEVKPRTPNRDVGFTPSTIPSISSQTKLKSSESGYVKDPLKFETFAATPGAEAEAGSLMHWAGGDQSLIQKLNNLRSHVTSIAPPGTALVAGEKVRAGIENIGVRGQNKAAEDLASAKTNLSKEQGIGDVLQKQDEMMQRHISAYDQLKAGAFPNATPEEMRRIERAGVNAKNAKIQTSKENSSQIQGKNISDAEKAAQEAEEAMSSASKRAGTLSKTGKMVGGLVRWLPGVFGAYDLAKTIKGLTTDDSEFFHESYNKFKGSDINLNRINLKKNLSEDKQTEKQENANNAAFGMVHAADSAIQKAAQTGIPQRVLGQSASTLARYSPTVARTVGVATMPEAELAFANPLTTAILAPLMITQSTATDDMIRLPERTQEEIDADKLKDPSQPFQGAKGDDPGLKNLDYVLPVKGKEKTVEQMAMNPSGVQTSTPNLNAIQYSRKSPTISKTTTPTRHPQQ
jgi:hypothetical protein